MANHSKSKAFKIATGMLLTPNLRTQMDIIKSQMPEVTFTQDKYNNIIVFMPDGKPFYLNKPGASTKDFVELTGQILQYIPGFSWAMKKAGKSYMKRVLLSGAAGGTTAVLQDIAATPLGSKEGIDVPEAAISTIAPVAFEAAITPVASALWKKIVGNSAYSKVIKKDGKDVYVLTKRGEEAAKAEVEKNQAMVASQLQLEEGKHKLEQQKMLQEAKLKKVLMDHEFQLNMQLKQVETEGLDKKEKYKEDRKDERTRIQASQQSELIDQRNTGKPPKRFESIGNDNLGTGFDLSQFIPR